ncbi:MAG: (Fe-S)-binding protein [Eubacteriales bacterium]|nr:(Fe-S)-binding protein [Eubacteriales bacterium]
MSLEDFRADALRCTRCAYCKWVPIDLIKSWRFSKGCPSIEFNHFHSYSAGGRYVTALSLLENRVEVTDKLKESVFKCQMCGNCDVTCKICRYDMEPLAAMHELRFTMVEGGHTIHEHDQVIEGYRKLNNMLKKPKDKKGDWANGIKIKDLTMETAEVVFHAGCQYSYDPELQKVARISVEILQNAGVDFGIMGKDENCCGGRAYHMGYKDDYINGAEKNLAAWKKAGVKTVITPCADCYHTFKRLYPQNGSTVEVLHMVEFVDRLIREGKIKFTKPVNKKVTYHDPCYLGRQGEPYIPWDGKEKKIFGQAVVYDPPRPRYIGAYGVYEAPRNILKAIPGVELVEMERIKEAAWCCGAGGGVKEAYPEFAKQTAMERIEEAQATGAEVIVSACPWCERNFMDIEADARKMEVIDILELVKQAI